MSESATTLASPRERRRAETTRALISLARRATAEHGLNGFTVEELCEQAGVSRRTFFNYFASKEDAVLGFAIDLDLAHADQRFLERRPEGLPPGTLSPTLLADLAALHGERWSIHGLDQESAAELTAAAEREPRLIAHMIDRGRRDEEKDVALVEAREGLAPGHPLAAVAVQIVAHLGRVAVPRSLDLEHPEPFAEVLAQLVGDAAQLFATQTA
ncbi:TetR/AcrR family transcriptional regulator [Agromyces sp. LHK192]|uniref:TetR/AcrR family transcriptional regulator n=1 Tax=Agromyces sp. LHK192 TaxID=2498704 RepID=UPI000FD9242F|nr:TetR/AcrR family transcriptional regulator [Agromyces sp. LHK192]